MPPNNWEDIVTSPDDQFDTCTYEEFMIAMSCWRFLQVIAVLMRVTNKETGKVAEYAYQKMVTPVTN